MAAQALYRRWRPQTFEDVVGQSHILQTLRNALAAGRVAHAYLFAGPRGTGKTTIARILARAVNCTAAPERRPCGECPVCRSLAEGRSLDLIEIDAASHTGVDNVRDLIDKVQFAPSEAQYKVYIIDEVHMLSTPAFNALLKTLEEPPPHALFFLATTEAHKIPATILSRCQRFSFQRIPLSDMVAHLTHICEAEGFQAEPAAIELIARYAQGGLRDAISLLDQMVAFGGANITLAQVQSVLGTAADAAVEVLAEHLVLGDTAGGLRLINQAVDAGVDARQLVNQLLEYLRSLMLVQNGSGGLLNVTAETQSRMEAQARRIAPAVLVRAIRLFTEAAQTQRSALQSQLPLELALVEATLDAARTPQPAMPPPPRVEVAAYPAERPAAPAHPAPVAATPAPRPAETPTGPARPSAEMPLMSSSTPVERKTNEDEVVLVSPAPPNLELHLLWEEVVNAVHQQSKPLAALLKDCYPIAISDNTLMIGVYYTGHQNRLEEPKRREMLETTLSQVVGRGMRVASKLTPKTRAEMDAERPKNPLQEATDDPVVKEAVRMGGKITGISLDT